jgi:peptide alpha-N-acetyltransferase
VGEELNHKTAEFIKSEFTFIPASTPLAKFNDAYLSQHKDCVRRTVSALKVRKLLSPEAAPSCEKDIAAVISIPSITFEEAKEVLELLCSWKSPEAKSFRSKAATKWPKATIFEGSE